ncbi:MAG: hypothetical protein J5873_02875 [Bacteroidales bacterium]|nr:hypothetical protein [Bacteroidales bacterium]
MENLVLFIDEPPLGLEEGLNRLGYTCERRTVDYDSLLPDAARYTGFVIRSRFVLDRKLLDASTRLRFIARIGAGMENIDTACAEAKGIRCLNSPEGNADAVAEYTIGSILNMLRRFAHMDTEVKNGVWQREANRGFELHRKTVGLLGYGHMGRTVARKLSGFGCRVIAYDKYLSDYGDAFAQAVSLAQLQAESDIFSMHINYLPENFHIVNQEFLEGFAKNILLVNTSRGKSLCTEGLVRCLQSGKVRMASLDVLEYESIRLQNRPKEEWDEAMRYLAASERVFLSPHVAGQTYESLEKHVDVLMAKIQALGL